MLPEQSLVLAATRSMFTPAELDGLDQPARVDYAVALASDLGIRGLVSDVLRRSPGADPLWSKAWYTTFTRNLLLVSELREWTKLLAAAGIRAIALKGPALAKVAFGHISRRDFIDLDLIVPREQFRASVAVCLARGWIPVPGQAALPDDDLRLTELTLYSPSSGYSLDLHAGWQPSWGRLADRDLSEEDLIEVDLSGSRFWTLGPELALIHAARHFARHRYSLKTLLDVGATLAQVRAYGGEAAARSRAEQMGVRKIVAVAIEAADKFATTGRAPSVPHGLGEPWILSNPAPPERVDLWMWLDIRRGHSPRRLFGEVLDTLWPSDDRVRESPEWIGANHLTLRRVLRPLRLITLFLRSARPARPLPKAAWRHRSTTGEKSESETMFQE
jgi:putative nucleotidyltransferase-like protein